ncbi:MAG: response regulator [Candidatus Latescibacterota bacterium]
MGKLILHIEDNASNRKVVQHILRRTPHRLLEAADGEAGLALAASARPDLILLDIQLPRLSGYQVAERLKADPALRHIPVIAITSYALSGDDARALEAGCDDYLAKPYRPQALLERLGRYLSP